MKLNDRQQLAVLTAIEKAAAEKKKEIRAKCDEDLFGLYEEDGIEKVAIKIGDTEVGKFILTFESDGYEITDREAFEDFALTYGLAEERKSIYASHMGVAVRLLEQEDPSGIETRVVVNKDWQDHLHHVGDAVTFMDSDMVVPGVRYVPKRPKGTQLRGCSFEAVAPPLRALGGIDALLLEGADE